MAQELGPLAPGYVRIQNLKAPGEWLILHSRDFDPVKHTRWEPPQVTVSASGWPTVADPKPAGPDGPASSGAAPAGASDRRAPTLEELRAYLAFRDAGLSHADACVTVWSDLEPPDEPSVAVLAGIRETVERLKAEAARPSVPTKRKRKASGNDLSAYDVNAR